MKVYPSELTIVFFYTSCVSILGAIVGYFAEPDHSKFKIRADVALVSILCSVSDSTIGLLFFTTYKQS